MCSALDLLQLTESDILLDIGAGEGNFIILAVERTNVRKAIGVEIVEERFEIALREMQSS